MKTYDEIFEKFQEAQNAVQYAENAILDSITEKEKDLFQRKAAKAKEFKAALFWALT